MFDRFYQARNRKGFAFGTHCWSADLALYEMSGRLGYDYVWIDNEHGGMSMQMVHGAIIAANASDCAALVRVPGHCMEDVKPVLEMGPQGVIFPMVNSAEEAEICVEHCKYPPKGRRSYGPLRAIDYYELPLDEYLERADRNLLCCIQCEHVDAVRNLEEILKVPGVDVIICGPMDLSASVGKLGQLDDPEVAGYMDEIIRKCKDAGKPFGMSIGMGSWALANKWLEQGANFVSVGGPYDFFSQGSHELLSKVRCLR